MKTTFFYFGLVICLVISCLDIHFTFQNETLMSEWEQNPVMFQLIKSFGIQGAMIVRFLSSFFAFSIVGVIFHLKAKKVSWILMSVWLVQQLSLVAMFFLCPGGICGNFPILYKSEFALKYLF